MPKFRSQSEVADFRERLCDVATRMFDTQGPEGFTMRELAAKLGVSAMTPYRYFKDKKDILTAVRARAFNRFAAAIEAAFASVGSAQRKLKAGYDAYSTFAFNEPAAYKLMFDLRELSDYVHPDLVKADSRARAAMTDYFRSMVADGELEGDADLIGHVFWASLHGVMVLKCAGMLPPGCDFDRISAEVFRVLFGAYRSSNA